MDGSVDERQGTAGPKVTVGLDRICSALLNGDTGLPEGVAQIVEMLRSGVVCGLVANASSVTADLDDACWALQRAGVRISALFAPEHGARGAVAAGESVASGSDEQTGLPVYSLYGETKKPTPEMLAGLDAIIYDLQDVGVRFWTYNWTLTYVMEACAEAGIPVILLDRPNPLGGEVVEGPLLEPDLASFVGRYPIPTRHGLTAGELALYFAGEHLPGARVLVAGMTGWNRSSWWNETGLEWSSPSPNLPTVESAWIYPATCFLEGTNVSEGRGTPLPFRSFGAPWVNARTLCDWLRAHTDSLWRPTYYTPTSSKYAGVACAGVQWYPPDDPDWRRTYRPVLLGLTILSGLQSIHPDRFEWLLSQRGRSHFDLLIGRADVRERLSSGETPASIAAGWDAQAEAFVRKSASYRLY